MPAFSIGLSLLITLAVFPVWMWSLGKKSASNKELGAMLMMVIGLGPALYALYFYDLKTFKYIVNPPF
jgi:hypothetical protein